MFIQTPQKRVLFPRTLTPVMVGGFLAFLVLFSLIITIFGAPKAHAATNGTLNFQARLENASGSIVPDGLYNVEFKVYNVSSAGSALWTETWYDSNGVTAGNDNRIQVRNGYVTANLGAQTAFPGTINWDQDTWITMNIGGTTQTATPTWDGEMNPRLKLTAVPYAFKAGQLATFNSGNGFTSTLQLLQPTSGNQTFQIPDQTVGGTYSICIANSAACGFALSSGNTNYIQNQPTLTSAQTGTNFWIDGVGRAATSLQAPLIDAATASTALNIGTTNASVINMNQNVVVASGKTFTANGPATFQASVASSSAFQIKNTSNVPLVSADTTTTNLVTNSSLEANITNWAAKVPTAGGGSSTLSQTSAQYFNGYSSLQTITTAANYGVQTSTFTSAITTATQYEATFMARCSASIATFTYGRQDVSGGTANDINASTTATCDTNWRRYTFHYTTGGTVTTPNIYMTLGSTASGTLWVDAVQVLQTSTSGAQPYSAGSIKIGGVISDAVAIRSSSNSTNAFEVQDSTGVSNSFVVDTVNNLVNIGGGLTVGAAPNNQVITSSRVLQNVTANTNILTSGQLNVARGGTGVDGSAAANGTLLIGNGSGYTLTGLTAGTGISITPGVGSITIANTGTAGSAGGDLTGTYPNPTIAKLQGGTLTISTVATDNILQYNGSAWVNRTISGDVTFTGGVAVIGTGKVTSGMIVDNTIADVDLATGTFAKITGTGALAAGSIASGFGTIATANTITGTTLNGTTGINTGATGGTQRIDASGNLVNIGTIGASGKITTTGDLTTGNQNTISLTRTLPTVVDSEVDLGSFSFTNGAGNLSIDLTVPSTGFSLAKQYSIPITWNGTSATWVMVQPVTETGPYGTDNVSLEINISNGTASLRLRRSSGTTAGTAYITIKQQGVSSDAFTPSTATAAVTAPTTYLNSAIASQGLGVFSIQGSLTVANGGALNLGGQTVLTSARVLQNVTADANILTAGTLATGRLSGSYTGITGVGTLTVGTWNATAIGAAYGGTGLSTATTNGIIYGNGTGVMGVTAAGTSAQILQSNGGGTPGFVTFSGDVTIAVGGAVTIGTGAVTSGKILDNTIADVDLATGTFAKITGTGALAAGSIASGFGTIATANTITGTTLNGTTGINTGAAAGTQRLDAAGALKNITGYTQTSGNASFSQNAADQFQILALQAPTTDMLSISNAGFPIATDGVNGQQIDYFAALSNAAHQASAQRLNITNTSATAGSTTNGLRIVATGAVAGTTNGIKIDNFTSGAGGASALQLGTGWKDLLSYNGTQLINGTGILQSAGISGTYSNLTGTGALAAGSIASGFGTIATANTITGTTINGTTGINTGAGSGTNRIDVSGNLVNIGTITSGLINSQTISSTANFTGTVAVATSIAAPLLQNAGTLNISATGANQVNLNTNGSLRWSVLSTGQFEGNGASTIRTSTGNLTLTSNGGNGGIVLTPNGTGVTNITAGDLQIGGTSFVNASRVVQSSAVWNGNTIGAQYGGTGLATVTTNGVLFGNGTSAMGVTAAGTTGQILQANGSGIPTFVSFSSDVTVAAGGAVTIATGAVTSAKIADNTIADADLATGTFAKITGTGALAAGSIASGFGTISTTNTIATTSSVSGSTLISTVSTGTPPLNVTSTTLVNNLNAQYLNSKSEADLAQNIRAGINVTGGGTVTFNSSTLSWDSRFIVIANGRGAGAATAGYFDITIPANATVITGVGGHANVTVASGAVPLAAWDALYYILPNGSASGSNAANFRVATYTADVAIPSDWVLLAVHNGDNTTARLGTGIILRNGQSTTAGSVNNAVFNTSVTTPLLQNAGTLTLSTSAGNINLNSFGTIELQKDTNVTGTLSVTTKVITPVLDAASGVLAIGNTNATSITLGRSTGSTNVATTVYGTAVFKPSGNSSAADSATALQIQNAAGTSYFTADSINQRITTKDLTVGSPATVGISSRLFTDGFETGDSSAWAGTGGSGTLAYNTATLRGGKYSQSITTSTNGAYSEATIAPSTTVYGRTYFNVTSLGNPTVLMDFGTGKVTAGNHLYIYAGASGNLCYNSTLNATVSACSTTPVSTSAWHKLETTITISGTIGVLQVYYDGNLVTTNSNAINLSAQNFGTTPLINFALGNNVSSTATAYFDDVAVDTVTTGDSSSLYVADSLHVSGSSSFEGVLASGTTATGYSIDAANGINASAGYSVGGQEGLSSSCTSGQGLNNVSVSGGIIVGGSCGNAASTLQNAYDNTSVGNGGTPSTPTFVRQVINNGNTSSLVTAITATSAGDLLVATIGTANSTSTASVTSVSGGGTWRLAAAGPGSTTTTRVEIWYCYNCGSTTSVTVNTIVNSNPLTVNISEYSGVQTSGDPLEASAGGTGASPKSATQVSPTIATTTANDLVIAGLSFYNSAVTSVSTPAGYTASTPVALATKQTYGDYRLAATAGNYNATWTLTGGTASGGAAIAAFKPAITGGSTVASILLTNAKDYIITSPDTATDSNVLINMQCRTGCSTSQGRWAVQSNGVDALSVLYDTTTTITNIRIQTGVDLKLAADSVGNARGAITHDFTCTSTEQPNDVVVISAAGTVARTATAANLGVAGVVVAKPGPTTCTVAVAGVVQVWGGAAAYSAVGDFVQTSATSGAARVQNTAVVGSTLGKALSTKDGSNLFWVLLMPG